MANDGERKYLLQDFYLFTQDIYRSRWLLYQLIGRDFKSKYLGSYLGITWVFIHPLVQILVLWFVFQIGFKSVQIKGHSFVPWLMTAILPWFFFADAAQNSASAILESGYLLKKVAFRASILPIVKILSATIIHCIFIGMLLSVCICYGYTPCLCWLQIFYYLFASIALLLGLAWITAPLAVFVKDVGQFISMFLQFGFWLTPIFWSLNILPPRYQFWIKINPVYYITEGYRHSLLYGISFWEQPAMTVYFWCVVLGLWYVGAIIFKRLRPYFTDVL